VSVLTDTKVHFYIKNLTTTHAFGFKMCSPFDPMLNRRLRVSGATAEWIMERPADPDTEAIYNLPDYNVAHFYNCFALSAYVPEGGVPGPAVERNLDAARGINMYKVERNPSRSVSISKATQPTVDRFDTEFVR
jgi:hypothetical protein